MLLNLDNLIKKYSMDIKGVIHIGAHHGQEVEHYLGININNIILFEPQKDCYDILQDKFGNKDIKIENIALGSETGEKEMYVESANMGQSSSLLKPAMHLQQYPNIVFNNVIKVNVTTLDKYVSENKIDQSNYNMINIDVQGYELEVFKGSKQFLNNVDYIITEINRAEVYEDCALARDLDDFLESYGFKRQETTWDGWTWGDAFYIKEKNDQKEN